MKPKPLSDAVRKGLAYLVNQQHPEGGWGQGGGWRSDGRGGRVEGPQVADPADVANTCTATLALLRAGHTPRDGEYSANVRRAVDFVVGTVERADEESPYVTELRGTQVQTKIGPYVDTFLASLALAEVKGLMPSDAEETRLAAALDKVVRKMERHQQQDGTWAAEGWAPVVGHSLAMAGLSRARQRGTPVSDEVLERAEKMSRSNYDAGTASYSLDGAAGVPLYGTASHLSSAQHSINSFQRLKRKLRGIVRSRQAPAAEQAQAAEKLRYYEEAELAQAESLKGSARHFSDAGFVSGFGSNGGEEFLSYLNISETLAVQGGKEWEDWDRKMTENMERIQNKDGSWAGHHCITGRTFCTAAALLVLMADRAPRPDVVVG
jgi:hypothetical protein